MLLLLYLRKKCVYTPEVEELILTLINGNPKTSARIISAKIIQWVEVLNRFDLQTTLTFSQWFLRKSFLFADEIKFNRHDFQILQKSNKNSHTIIKS